MIQKPMIHSFDSRYGPSVNNASLSRPSTTVAVSGAAETAGEDPVTVGLHLLVEDVDRGHLRVGRHVA